MHLRTCGYCWTARKQLYHECVPIFGVSGNICYWLKCANCRLARKVRTGERDVLGYLLSTSWMVYPCGWWDGLSELLCNCAYLDVFGHLLLDGAPIFTPDEFLMENVTQLRIDYIHSGGVVKFAGRRKVTFPPPSHVSDDDIDDDETMYYTDDHHGPLHISEIIRVAPFRKMIPLVKYFLNHTLPNLHTGSLLLKSLPFLTIKRLSWTDSGFKSLLCGASTRSDATLVSYLYGGGQTRQGLRHLRPPVIAIVDEDDYPRHNDDWKWEQHSGDLHAPERPSGFQGPEIFTARCHVAD